MKSKYLNLCIGAAALLSLQGCDDLLDRNPKDKLTENVVYNSYESLKLMLGNCMMHFRPMTK